MDDLIRRKWLVECVREGWIKFDTQDDENRFIHLVRDIAPSVEVEHRDAISRREVIKRVNTWTYDMNDPEDAWAAEHEIKTMPPVQPETAKRIVGKSRNGMTLWYQCDMCNEPVDPQDNYCCGCGRRLTDG